jgi:hypothetical protein
VTPQEANARQERFFADIHAQKRLWLLQNDLGYANWSSDDGTALPVWSDRELAAECAIETFAGYRPEEIALETFIDSVLPELEAQDIFVGINLTSDMCGNELSCSEFTKELATRDT